MSFWDQFKADIHSNVKLNNIDKFNYLILFKSDTPNLQKILNSREIRVIMQEMSVQNSTDLNDRIPNGL